MIQGRVWSDYRLGGVQNEDEDIYEVLQKKQDEFTKSSFWSYVAALSNLKDKEPQMEARLMKEEARNSSPVQSSAQYNPVPQRTQEAPRRTETPVQNPTQSQGSGSQQGQPAKKPVTNNLFGDPTPKR